MLNDNFWALRTLFNVHNFEYDNASSVILNIAETTFTPILLPAITRTLLLPQFWHNYYKAQEK